MKKKHYVDNKRFQELLEKWFNEKDRYSFNEIGKIFLQITSNILQKPGFMNYSKDYKDEMTSDATYYMVRYIKSYDITRGNPFAYFSEIAFKTFTHYLGAINRRNQKIISLSFIEEMARENE
jgi:hypothetical protein